MGILHVTKKKVPEVLTKRLLQQLAMKDSSLDQLDMNTDQKFNDGRFISCGIFLMIKLGIYAWNRLVSVSSMIVLYERSD